MSHGWRGKGSCTRGRSRHFSGPPLVWHFKSLTLSRGMRISVWGIQKRLSISSPSARQLRRKWPCPFGDSRFSAPAILFSNRDGRFLRFLGDFSLYIRRHCKRTPPFVPLHTSGFGRFWSKNLPCPDPGVWPAPGTWSPQGLQTDTAVCGFPLLTQGGRGSKIAPFSTLGCVCESHVLMRFGDQLDQNVRRIEFSTCERSNGHPTWGSRLRQSVEARVLGSFRSNRRDLGLFGVSPLRSSGST